ncbi:Mitochondrial tom complex subunit tom70, partial [Globisporangium splendens]
MGSAKLVVALYRSMLRSAKVLDAHREFKALLPREVIWNAGDSKCDFFSTDASCVDTIRREFRVPKTAAEIDAGVDESFTINKAIAERVHLLYEDEHARDLMVFHTPQHTTSFAEKYEQEKQKQKSDESANALEDAITLIKSASEVLKNEGMSSDDRARIAKTYYTQSIKSFPTADAHAYLGWHYYLDGELEKAAAECERAIELDPGFGNAYNDLGLIRVQQGHDEEAMALFSKAKEAPRYDVRHFPSLNLAALHLENDRIKPALHEYIEALRWMQPDEAVAIRNTVADMGTFYVTITEKLRSTT